MKFNKFLWILSIFFLLSLSVVSSTIDNTNLVAYYSFDAGTLVDDFGSFDLTNAGSSNATGIISNGRSFTTDDYAYINDVSILSNTMTLSFWIKPTDTTPSAEQRLFEGYGGDGSFIVKSYSNGSIATTIYDGVDARVMTFTPIQGNWYNIILSFNNSNVYYFLNGVLTNTYSFDTVDWTGSTGFVLGSTRTRSSSFYSGLIDEFAVFDAIITQTQARDIYYNGSGCNMVSGVCSYGVSPNFSVSVVDEWSGVDVDNINVTVNGTTYTNSTGNTVITSLLQNATSLYDIVIVQNDGTYFSRNYSNYNVSSDLEAGFHQSEVNFSAYEFITNNTVSGGTCTVNTTSMLCSESFNLSVGDYNVTFSKTGYINKTVEFNVSALDIKTVDITDVFGTLINITPKDILTNASLSNFTGWLYDNDNDINMSFSTSDSYYLLPGVNNTNCTLSVSPNGYATETSTFITNVTYYNVSTYHYVFNSIRINIYDLLEGGLITQEVDIDVISDLFSSQVNTSNGTYYLTLLTPEDYELRFKSNGYVSSSYFIGVTNDSTQNLNVYLLNSTGTYNVTINVIDESAQNVEGAIVKASRYDISSNTYILYSAGVTNSDGEVLLSVTFNDNYYKFSVELDGETKKVTVPQYITGSTLVIQIILSDLAGTGYFNYLGIDSSLIFNTVTNNFRLTYNDIDGLGTSYCLYVYQLSGLGDTLVNSSCSSSSSGTILLGVSPINGTSYVARAYYDEEFLIDASYTFPSSNTSGELGLLMQLFLTLAMSLLAFADLGLLPISIGASLVFGKLAMLNSFGWPGIAAFMVVMIIISVGMYGFRG